MVLYLCHYPNFPISLIVYIFMKDTKHNSEIKEH